MDIGAEVGQVKHGCGKEVDGFSRCRATLRAMARAFRKTSGPITCVPTLNTTPPCIRVIA